MTSTIVLWLRPDTDTCSRVLLAIATSTAAFAQTAVPPRNAVDVRFAPAPLLVFPNPTDSNTPVIWIGDELAVFSSESGRTLRATGATLETSVSDDNDDLTPAVLGRHRQRPVAGGGAARRRDGAAVRLVSQRGPYRLPAGRAPVAADRRRPLG